MKPEEKFEILNEGKLLKGLVKVVMIFLFNSGFEKG